MWMWAIENARRQNVDDYYRTSTSLLIDTIIMEFTAYHSIEFNSDSYGAIARHADPLDSTPDVRALSEFDKLEIFVSITARMLCRLPIADMIRGHSRSCSSVALLSLDLVRKNVADSALKINAYQIIRMLCGMRG